MMWEGLTVHVVGVNDDVCGPNDNVRKYRPLMWGRIDHCFRDQPLMWGRTVHLCGGPNNVVGKD